MERLDLLVQGDGGLISDQQADQMGRDGRGVPTRKFADSSATQHRTADLRRMIRLSGKGSRALGALIPICEAKESNTLVTRASNWVEGRHSVRPEGMVPRKLEIRDPLERRSLLKGEKQIKKFGALLTGLLLASACAAGPATTREKGALTGAAIGAGTGAIIGSQTGKAGTGALIGGGIGGVSGAIVGDAIQAKEQAPAAPPPAATPAPAPPPAPAAVVPPAGETVYAKEVRAHEVRAHTIYANKIKAAYVRGRIYQMSKLETHGWPGEIKAPVISASVIYANEIKADSVEADTIYVHEIKTHGWKE